MKQTYIYIIFIVLGIAVAAYGVYTQFFQTKGFAKTTAIIERIDTTYMGYNDETMQDEYEYTTYVNYTVDGQEYTGKLDISDASFEEGQQVDVMYNPSNPSEMYSEPGITGFIMIVAGVVVAIGAAVMLLRELGIHA